MKILIDIVFTFLTTLINVLLLPINALVVSLFPDLQTALTGVQDFLGWLPTFTAWVISWLPFDSNFYTFTIGALLAIFLIPLSTNLIKLVVKWWHYLAP